MLSQQAVTNTRGSAFSCGSQCPQHPTFPRIPDVPHVPNVSSVPTIIPSIPHGMFSAFPMLPQFQCQCSRDFGLWSLETGGRSMHVIINTGF